MALQNGFPGHTALASFADLRRDLEGTVVRSAAGVLRAGVFPDHLDPLVTGRTDMKVNIADFRAVQNRGGAIFLANVGVDSSVTLDAAPASNKRIDLVYVYQRSVTLGDAASTPVFGVVKGTASATPTVPLLPAGVSTAIPLATVEIPAGATTTLSVGVIFTQVHPYTAMAGGTVYVRSTVERDAGNFTLGQVVSNAGAIEALTANGWAGLGGGLVHLTPSSVVGGTVQPDGAVSFTGASAVSLNGVFSADFRHYKIVVDATLAAQLQFRFRAGGVDNGTASAYQSQMQYSNSTAIASSSLNTSAGNISPGGSYSEYSHEATIFNPALGVPTRMAGAGYGLTTAAGIHLTAVGCRHISSAAFDGISLLPGAGTMTGRVSVYGVRG